MFFISFFVVRQLQLFIACNAIVDDVYVYLCMCGLRQQSCLQIILYIFICAVRIR